MGRDYEQERVKPFCHEHTERVSWDELMYEKMKVRRRKRLTERDEWGRGGLM